MIESSNTLRRPSPRLIHVVNLIGSYLTARDTKRAINTHSGESHSIGRQKVCFHGKTTSSFSKMPREKSPNWRFSSVLEVLHGAFFSVTPIFLVVDFKYV